MLPIWPHNAKSYLNSKQLKLNEPLFSKVHVISKCLVLLFFSHHFVLCCRDPALRDVADRDPGSEHGERRGRLGTAMDCSLLRPRQVSWNRQVKGLHSEGWEGCPQEEMRGSDQLCEAQQWIWVITWHLSGCQHEVVVQGFGSMDKRIL